MPHLGDILLQTTAVSESHLNYLNLLLPSTGDNSHADM